MEALTALEFKQEGEGKGLISACASPESQEGFPGSEFSNLNLQRRYSHLSSANSIIGWLNVFNAELSPKRYWRGLRSQEVGKEGDYT